MRYFASRSTAWGQKHALPRRSIAVCIPINRHWRACQGGLSYALIADISCSLDHLVGDREYARCNREAKRFSGFKVDHQLECCWLKNRQIGGFLTLLLQVGCRGTVTARSLRQAG